MDVNLFFFLFFFFFLHIMASFWTFADSNTVPQSQMCSSHHGKSHSNLCKPMSTTIIRSSSNSTYDPSLYTVNLQTQSNSEQRSSPLRFQTACSNRSGWGEENGERISSNRLKSCYKSTATKWQETKDEMTSTATLVQFLLKMVTVIPGEGGDVWRVINDKTIKWAEKLIWAVKSRLESRKLGFS